jgi:tetratricopeptide (TPR) repeat protein
MSHIAKRSFNPHWASTVVKLVTVLGGLTLTNYVAPVAAQSYKLSTAPITRMNAQDFFNQAMKKTERGDFTSAIKDFNQVLQINPTFIEAYCNRGMARAELGDYLGQWQTWTLHCTSILTMPMLTTNGELSLLR